MRGSRSTRRLGAVMASVCLLFVAAQTISPRLRADPAQPSPGAATRDRGLIDALEVRAPDEAPPPAVPDGRHLVTSDAGAAVHVVPPAHVVGDASRAPVTTVLHGMCSDPLRTCEAFGGVAALGSWLVCPSGNGSCGGASDWRGSGAEKAAWLAGSDDAVDRAYGPHITHDGDVIVGFSRGAFVARDVIYERPGRYVGVVLIGAAMVPDAKRLLASGVRRVVLASGDFDGARPTMERAVPILQARGLEARFVRLGPYPHQLPPDLAPFLRDALGWIRGADDRTAAIP